MHCWHLNENVMCSSVYSRMQSARQTPGARYKPTGDPGHIALEPQDGDSSLLRNRAKDQQAEHHYDDDVMIIINRDKPMGNMKIIIPKTTW